MFLCIGVCFCSYAIENGYCIVSLIQSINSEMWLKKCIDRIRKIGLYLWPNFRVIVVLHILLIPSIKTLLPRIEYWKKIPKGYFVNSAMVCSVEFILGSMSMTSSLRICVLIVVGLSLLLYGSVINCVNNVS